MSEPQHEAEDDGCACTEDGIESAWEWDEEEEMYICSGCGEVQ